MSRAEALQEIKDLSRAFAELPDDQIVFLVAQNNLPRPVRPKPSKDFPAEDERGQRIDPEMYQADPAYQAYRKNLREYQKQREQWASQLTGRVILVPPGQPDQGAQYPFLFHRTNRLAIALSQLIPSAGNDDPVTHLWKYIWKTKVVYALHHPTTRQAAVGNPADTSLRLGMISGRTLQLICEELLSGSFLSEADRPTTEKDKAATIPPEASQPAEQIAVDDDDLVILETLETYGVTPLQPTDATEDATRLMASRVAKLMDQTDIEQATGILRRPLSKRTIGPRLKSLFDVHLVAKPKGNRKGYAITDLGREVLRMHRTREQPAR